MSVQLSFNVCQNSTCKVLTFFETTGAYTATNIGGWGSPNELTSDAVAAVLTVTDPAGLNTYTFNLFTNSPAYPTTSDLTGFAIQSQDLGLATGIKIPDGIYTFNYTVTTATSIYTQTSSVFLMCAVACCVWKIVAKVAEGGCDCNSSAYENALKVMTLFRGLCYAAKCGHTDSFDDLMDTINNYCEAGQCNC